MAAKPEFTYRRANRAAFVKGLRDLADYLEANPGVPTPYAPHILVTHSAETDAARREYIADAAVNLGSRLIEDAHHFTTARRFGGLIYQVWASTIAGDEDWHARHSYADAVRP